MSVAAIQLENITKRYRGGALAVDQINLHVAPGELIAILGPSGCGKTTLLRLIAGLELPDAGEIWLGSRQVAGASVWVLPESRGVGLVFQDGVLFPHLSVADNIAFGLRQMSREMQATRVAELLTLVGLGGFEQRNPQHLSGGQQQRIALARALAPRPPVLLLDEPFANLDAALRNELRQELREIVLATGTTALFVTHDQEEALSIADRAAVIDRGQIVQLGTPQAIYERPASSYVARFVGTANLVAAFGHGAHAVCILGEIALRDRYEGALELMIRPEQLLLTSDELGNAIVERITYYGYDLLITLRVSDGSSLQARIRPGSTLRPGSRVRVTTTEAVVAFPQLGMELR